MVDKFGAMDSYKEINELAENLFNEGDTDSLRVMAKENGIPFQKEVMGGDTGTDADSIAGAGAGVPTALLSIPLRYMHTTVETLSFDDVTATGDLLAETLIHLKGEEFSSCI